MPFWKKKDPAVTPTDALRDQATPRPAMVDRQTLVDAMRPATSLPKARALGGLLGIIPFDKLFTGIFSVLRDPNGKISSKRAGAGALITAGIYFLSIDKTLAGIVCLAFALALFILTKWDTSPEP